MASGQNLKHYISGCFLYGHLIVIFTMLVVQIDTQNEGPWLRGRVGLSIAMWFPRFDATSMVVTSLLLCQFVLDSQIFPYLSGTIKSLKTLGINWAN